MNLQKIRVLIADDSSFMRVAFSQILKSDPAVEVVGAAADGAAAVRLVEELRPDVMLLGIVMPGFDGIEVLRHVMAQHPLPVVAISGASDPSLLIKALDAGAVDFIRKPSGLISYDIDTIRTEILDKVKIAAQAHVGRIAGEAAPMGYPFPAGESAPDRLVVIGASTGGPRAIGEVLAALPRSLPAAVLVVQHMGAEMLPFFVDGLKWRCSLDVSLARQDEPLAPGRALVAPGGRRLAVANGGTGPGRIRLGRAAPGHVSPSIDLAMKSAARVYRAGAVGVLLTGAGSDGAEGIQAIKNAGGGTIVEAESTCVVFGMPRTALETGCVDEVMPLPFIARGIMRRLCV